MVHLVCQDHLAHPETMGIEAHQDLAVYMRLILITTTIRINNYVLQDHAVSRDYQEHQATQEHQGKMVKMDNLVLLDQLVKLVSEANEASLEKEDQ